MSERICLDNDYSFKSTLWLIFHCFDEFLSVDL
jgi:hypothetical protein